MSINYPDLSQIPQLRALWKNAFGDTEEFLDIFFSRGFSPDRCRCVTVDGSVVAALYWFDAVCSAEKYAYLYAVATDPAHRGRGLCRALMEDVKELLAGQDYAGLILVPQNDSLAAMYRRMGYRDCTYVTEFTAPAEDTPLTLRRLTVREYAEARRSFLPADAVLQEGENLDFLNGFSLFFSGNGWLAAVSIEGRKLHCHELLGDPDVAYSLVSALGCEEGFFRIPGDDKPFTQCQFLKPVCRKMSYFGLAFD